MNKKGETQRGITLIALVITIIVMLILVAVTISMAVNGGLFDYAGKAVSETKNALDTEQKLADGGIKVGDVWYNSIEEYLNKIPSTEVKPLVNVRDSYEWIEDCKLNGNGVIVKGASSIGSAYVRVPVTEGESWCIWYEKETYLRPGSFGAVRLENSNNEQVGTIDLSIQPNCKIDEDTFVRGAVFEIPDNVSYMCVNLQYDAINQRNSAIIAKYNSNLTWVSFGDSITVLNDGFDTFVPLSSYNLSLPFFNYGQGSTGYLARHDESVAYIDKLNKITSNADLITFFGSFNDIGVAEIGSATDVYIEGGNNTLAACMNYCYDYVLTNFPDAKIAVISSTPWYRFNPNDTTSSASQYVAVMKEICENKGIPFLDLFHESGLEPWEEANKEQYFQNADGIHPNADGAKLIEKKVTPFLKSVLKG